MGRDVAGAEVVIGVVDGVAGVAGVESVVVRKLVSTAF